MLFMAFSRLKVAGLYRSVPALSLAVALSACGGAGAGGDTGVGSNVGVGGGGDVNSCVSSARSTFCGTVSGLPSGQAIVLDFTTSDAGNTTLTVTANGAFSVGLNTPLDITTTWDVGVRTQPSSQTSCSVTNGGSNLNPEGLKTTSVAGIVITCSAAVYYSVGGTLSGLDSGAQVTLGSFDAVDDASDNLTLTANGTFTFPAIRGVVEGYGVGVVTQPADQTCTVTDGSGYPLDGNVNNVLVTCLDKHSIGGAVTGLISGEQVTLEDNGGDALNVNADGAFAFATRIVEGGTYNVTVQTQPQTQICAVAGAGGTVSGNVTGVQVTCTTIERTVYAFTGGSDGARPFAGLIMDSSGNFYGTTAVGGTVNGSCSAGCGTVFKLAPDGNGGYNESVLYAFTGGSDGGFPEAGLILDSSGNLYGTTWGGGTGAGTNCNTAPSGCGVVFKLAPSGGGYVESVLYTFSGVSPGVSDGQNPYASLLMDTAGNLYGTTQGGGADTAGTVFRLTPSGGAYTESILYSFSGRGDGGGPMAGLIMDSAGNLYGTTATGGSSVCMGGCGTVFRLAPNGGGYTESVLYAFTDAGDGGTPRGNLIVDGSGNLYSTTEGGGNGYGVVFELTPNGSGGYAESVLHAFNSGTDGAYPVAGLIVDSAGDLYGTTIEGGVGDSGTIFKLVPNGSGGYNESVYFGGLSGNDGPMGGVTMDSAGNVFGTTGSTGNGTVFEVYPH
jgi:uncharacterized repeat protein (TIGR03803 family)